MLSLSKLFRSFESRYILRWCQKHFTTVQKNIFYNASACYLENCNYDTDYICNPKNFDEIDLNIKNRKRIGNISRVHDLWKDLNDIILNSEKEVDDQKQGDHLHKLLKEFYHEISQIPNKSHPDVIIGDESKAKTLETIGTKKNFTFSPQKFEDLAYNLDILHTKKLGHVSENRSYFFKGALTNLEQALIQFTINKLKKSGFTLMSVPDLLYPSILKGCGMLTKDDNQIYFLDSKKHGEVCLSGTAEMALAGYFQNKHLKLEDLPQKLAAVSRCYRSDFSSDVTGIYRVNEFSKIEMFALVGTDSESESDKVLNELVNLQKELFSDLELHCRVLDMPSQELGAQAYRKYDIEAFMYGRSIYGEISSASNCTDFQSRRLNITFGSDKPNDRRFVHTLNATACAIPRMLIALLETNQQMDGSINIVKALKPYMGQDVIKSPEKKENRSWIKFKSKQ